MVGVSDEPDEMFSKSNVEGGGVMSPFKIKVIPHLTNVLPSR